jgi:hypothetical protein
LKILIAKYKMEDYTKADHLNNLEEFLKLGEGDKVHVRINGELRILRVKHKPVSELEVYVAPIQTETIPNAELIALKEFRGVVLRYRDPTTHLVVDKPLKNAVVEHVPRTNKEKKEARRQFKKASIRQLFHIVAT